MLKSPSDVLRNPYRIKDWNYLLNYRESTMKLVRESQGHCLVQTLVIPFNLGRNIRAAGFVTRLLLIPCTRMPPHTRSNGWEGAWFVTTYYFLIHRGPVH